MAGEGMTVPVIDQRPEYIIEVDRLLGEQDVVRLRRAWMMLHNRSFSCSYWHKPGTPYPRLRSLDA